MRYWVIILGIVFLLCACQAIDDQPAVVSSENEVGELEFEEVFPAKAIQVLDQPTTVSVAEAASHIGEFDEVMGITIEGESRAYPIGLMNRYEIANDTLGGQAVAVTFCAYCNTGISFLRSVESEQGESQTLHFEVSGQFLDNAMVMMDRESGSLWAQSRLQAVEGSFTGQTLALLTASQVPWVEWVKAHPETTLVIDESVPVTGADNGFVLPALPSAESNVTSDSEEMTADYVVGVASEENAWAFPIEKIEQVGVINEEIAGQAPFVLVALAQPGAIMAWQRTHDGQTLTFVQENDTLKDKETGTIWNKENGRAEEGPLQGAQLQSFATQFMHWLGWLDLHPTSELWQGL